MKSRYYIALFVILSGLYLGLALFVTPDKATLAQYHLSSSGARALTLSIVIPLIIVWAAGLYGSLKLKEYAGLLKKSVEGPPLHKIGIGLLILVLTQPFKADYASLTGLVVRHSHLWLKPLTIINNYLGILTMAVGLFFVARGADKLCELLRQKRAGNEQQVWVAIFVVISSFYSYLLLSQPFHTNLNRRLYFMPNWLIVLTIAIPYLFVWYRGFSAAQNIYRFQRNVKGQLYRGSLTFIALGVGVVVFSSVAISFLTTTSAQLSRLSLTPILFIIYAFLILTAAGYLMIAYGARKLRRIEEV